MHWPIICSQDEEDENFTTLMLNCLLLIGERLSGKSGCLWKKSGDINPVSPRPTRRSHWQKSWCSRCVTRSCLTTANPRRRWAKSRLWEAWRPQTGWRTHCGLQEVGGSKGDRFPMQLQLCCIEYLTSRVGRPLGRHWSPTPRCRACISDVSWEWGWAGQGHASQGDG